MGGKLDLVSYWEWFSMWCQCLIEPCSAGSWNHTFFVIAIRRPSAGSGEPRGIHLQAELGSNAPGPRPHYNPILQTTYIPLHLASLGTYDLVVSRGTILSRPFWRKLEAMVANRWLSEALSRNSQSFSHD